MPQETLNLFQCMYGHGGFFDSDSSASIFRHANSCILHLLLPCLSAKLPDHLGNLANPSGSQRMSLAGSEDHTLISCATSWRTSSSPGEFHPRCRVEGATQWVPQPPQNVACRFPALRSSEFDSQHSECFHILI